MSTWWSRLKGLVTLTKWEGDDVEVSDGHPFRSQPKDFVPDLSEQTVAQRLAAITESAKKAERDRKKALKESQDAEALEIYPLILKNLEKIAEKGVNTIRTDVFFNECFTHQPRKGEILKHALIKLLKQDGFEVTGGAAHATRTKIEW